MNISNKHSSPLVSVIIPAYNSERYIQQAILSVLLQTYNNIEIIVVDDGSVDNTAYTVAIYQKIYSNITMLTHKNNKNQGVSHSRKLGINHAKGKYIAFLDADDYFLPHKIDTQVQWLEKNSQAVLCHTAVTVLVESNNPVLQERTFNFSNKPHIYHLQSKANYLIRNHICNSSVMVKAELVRGLIFESKQHFQFEDWLLWILLSELKGYFLYLPKKLTLYRDHDTSFSAGWSKLMVYYARIELYICLLSRSKTTKTIALAILHLTGQLIQLYKHYRQQTLS